MASAWPTPADSTDIFRADMLEAISKALLERGALGFTLSGESGISDGTYLGWYIKHHTLRADPPDYNLDFRVFDTDNGMEGWDCQYAVEGFRDSKDDVPLPYDTYSQYTPYHFFN